jgi:predicted HicB family RNase H-like nuclease
MIGGQNHGFYGAQGHFLRNNPDYSTDISNFMTYMITIRKFVEPEQIDMMVNGIKTEILLSLRHYVEICQIKKQEPAKSILLQ